MINKKRGLFLVVIFLLVLTKLALAEEKGIEGSFWLWFGLFLFLLLIIIYLLSRRSKEIIIRPIIKKIKERSRFFIRSKEIKEREKRIKKLIEERERKRGVKERKELFGLFGFGEVKERKLSYVGLLEKIAKAHELRKRRWAKEVKEERDIFKELDSLVKRLKRREIEKLAEEEAKEIFERLKGIVEKRK